MTWAMRGARCARGDHGHPRRMGGGVMTGLLASSVGAYGALRGHQGRIPLSLIGAARSVFALTAVMGGGAMLTSALIQSSESWAGRDTTLSVYPTDVATDATAEEMDETVLEQVDRLGIDQRSRRIYDGLRVQTTQGVRAAEVQGVDPAYGTIFRTQVVQGRWLADSDAARLSPALVVNQPMYEMLGSPELGTEPVTIYGPTGATHSEQAIIVGVLPANPDTDWSPSAFMHASALSLLPGREQAAMASDYQLWVPPEQADEIRDRLANALAQTEAGSFDVQISSMRPENLGIQGIAYGVSGAALLILLLGALGLVNISLVTVRFRVREIGIRRSYGATGGRIFVGVLMESVVA